MQLSPALQSPFSFHLGCGYARKKEKKKHRKEFSRMLSCHVAVSSEWSLLVEASLCLEAVERPQWPRVYLLDRPRSRSRMPSLVGDSGQVLGVLTFAKRQPCHLKILSKCHKNFRAVSGLNKDSMSTLQKQIGLVTLVAELLVRVMRYFLGISQQRGSFPVNLTTTMHWKPSEHLWGNHLLA